MGHNPTDYRQITVPGDGSDSDVWRVGGTGDGFPPAGWLVWAAATVGGGTPEIRSSITLRGPWQSSAAQIELSLLELNHGGVFWIPFPRFDLGPFTDEASSGATIRMDLAACPLPLGMPIPPEAARLYSRTPSRTTIAATATSTVTIPDGATAYCIGMAPDAGWTGPLQIEERSTGGGVNAVERGYALAGTSQAPPTNSTGWQDAPAGPADILLTNSDNAAAVQFSARWRFDLLSVR